jgi:hypothetical protein
MLSSVDDADITTSSLIFGEVNVLFVRVCVFVVPTTAPVAPCASVRFACVVTSEVSATVPVASGSVIVRSAVGSVTASVVSNHLLLHLQKQCLIQIRQLLLVLKIQHHMFS